MGITCKIFQTQAGGRLVYEVSGNNSLSSNKQEVGSRCVQAPCWALAGQMTTVHKVPR